MTTDENTRFEFLCKAAGFEDPTDLPVWKWECHEALSQPYRLLIDLAVPHENLQEHPYQKLLGARGTFRVTNGAQTPWNQWQGIITTVQMAGVESIQTRDDETSLYLYLQVVLEPQFVLLRQETTSRVHVLPEQGTVRQLSHLIRDAMKRADLRTEHVPGMPRSDGPAHHADYAITLGRGTDSWQEKDFFFQYKETTLDFLSRHLEHRGAYYRFDQSDSGKETILFCDETTPLPPDEEIELANWQAKASLIPDDSAGFLYHFAQHHAISPRMLSIDEFNPNDTKLKLQLSKPVSDDAMSSPQNPYASWGRMSLSGDGYRKQSDGETQLERYRQGQVCRQNQYQAKGLIRDLHAGSVFELQGHALSEFNQQYHVTQIQYRGEQPLPYDTKTETTARLWSEFSVLPADIAFRPERVTPRPHIPGLLHAIVEAEEISSEDAPLDLHDQMTAIEKDLAAQKQPIIDNDKAIEKAKEARANALKQAATSPADIAASAAEIQQINDTLDKLYAKKEALEKDKALQDRIKELNTKKRALVHDKDADIKGAKDKLRNTTKKLQEAKDKRDALNKEANPKPSDKWELSRKVADLEAAEKAQKEALEALLEAKNSDDRWDKWEQSGQSKVTGSNDPNESWVKPYLSKDGYYRIRFLCTDNATDLPENRTGKNSAWVRMATPYAGTTSNQDGEFGMYFPLKAGTEVLVAFMDGDPDEPIIVASVPNSAHRSLANYEEKKKNTSGFVMPGGNMLTFVNKEANKTAILFSPIADSFMLLGGDLDVPGHQGILIHSQGHITTKADSEKKMVEGKGFSRAYDLNVGEKPGVKPSDKKNLVEKKSKFEADWLHPDSGASFTISKPKANFGLDINPLNIDIGGSVGVNFSIKFGVNLALKASANFSVELAVGKSINLLEKKVTEKKNELKIQERTVTALKDTLTAGEHSETILSYEGKYGAYSATTKSIHRVEAEDGVVISAVDTVADMPGKMRPKTVTKVAPTLPVLIVEALQVMNPLNIKNTFNDWKKKARPTESADLSPVKLKSVIKKAGNADLRAQDKSFLVLTKDGLRLGTKGTANFSGKTGQLDFTDEATMTAAKKMNFQVNTTRLSLYDNGAGLVTKDSNITIKTNSNEMQMTSAGMKFKASGAFTCNGSVIKLG